MMLVVAANDIMVCVIRYRKGHQPIRVTWWEITVWCYVMSCHVMSSHVMSCHVMSCHVISRRVMIDMRCLYGYYYLSVMVRLKSLLLTLTSASCFSCVLSKFPRLTFVYQDGMTALMWAVKGNYRRSVERLLDGGANTEIRDKVYNMMWCDLMWCDVMWCDVMWCDVMLYDITLCHVVRRDTLTKFVWLCFFLFFSTFLVLVLLLNSLIGRPWIPSETLCMH